MAQALAAFAAAFACFLNIRTFSSDPGPSLRAGARWHQGPLTSALRQADPARVVGNKSSAVPSEIARGTTYRAILALGSDSGYYKTCADFACNIDFDGSEPNSG